MEQKVFWELFMDTGSPEAYLLYRRSCCRMDNEKKSNVLPENGFKLL